MNDIENVLTRWEVSSRLIDSYNREAGEQLKYGKHYQNASYFGLIEDFDSNYKYDNCRDCPILITKHKQLSISYFVDHVPTTTFATISIGLQRILMLLDICNRITRKLMKHIF